MSNKNKKTVCVALDGVLADYSKGWQGIEHIGDPIPGAKEFLESLSEFCRVIIYTTRCSHDVNNKDNKTAFQLVQIVRRWLNDNKLKFDDVWTGQGKPLCSAFIDDRAIACTPQSDARAFPSAVVKAKRLCGEA